MANEAFKFTGEDALNYEQYLGPLLFEPSALELLSFVGPPDVPVVLEIACGTGRLTRHLRYYFPSSTKLVASDISPDMIELARSHLKDPSIEFQMADAQQLPFSDNSFDLVVCQYGLMFLPERLKGFKEIFRVLKPGGRLVFSTWDSVDKIPLVGLIFNQFILPFFQGEDLTRFLVPFSMYEPAILSGLLQDAGFTDCSVVPIQFTSRSVSPEAVVNGFLVKHPLGRQVAAKDPAAVEPMAEEMQRRLALRFGVSDFVFDLKALVGIGRK